MKIMEESKKHLAIGAYEIIKRILSPPPSSTLILATSKQETKRRCSPVHHFDHLASPHCRKFSSNLRVCSALPVRMSFGLAPP